MILFYGADSLIEKPAFNSPKSNPSNDYGRGFYLTPDKNIAKLWASRFDSGYCIKYDVNMDGMNHLILDEKNNESILRWITLLVQHRFSKDEYESNKNTIDWLIQHYPIDIDNVDIITGYRADDAYFRYSRDFVQNELSLQALSSAMHLGKLGKQFVLKSKESFNRISIVDYERVIKDDSYEVFRRQTANEYRKIKEKDDINNIFIRDIMRGK